MTELNLVETTIFKLPILRYSLADGAGNPKADYDVMDRTQEHPDRCD